MVYRPSRNLFLYYSYYNAFYVPSVTCGIHWDTYCVLFVALWSVHPHNPLSTSQSPGIRTLEPEIEEPTSVIQNFMYYMHLAYRTGQSVDFTKIGNPVTWLVFPLSRHQQNYRVITVNTFYFDACYTCKFNIAYQIWQSFDFTMIVSPSCCRLYSLQVLKWVRTQVVMTSLGDIKRLLPTR